MDVVVWHPGSVCPQSDPPVRTEYMFTVNNKYFIPEKIAKLFQNETETRAYILGLVYGGLFGL